MLFGICIFDAVIESFFMIPLDERGIWKCA